MIGKARNPNIEARNKYKIQITKIPNACFGHSNLKFRICFGFRDSCFGFTLLELLIVISIIAILAATLIPNIIGFDTEARLASSKTNLNTLRTRLSLFRAKEGRYPKEFEELTTVTYNDAGIEKPYLEQIPVEFISDAAGNNQLENLNSADPLPDDGGWVYLTDKAKVIIDWEKELDNKWGKSEGQIASKW